MKGVGNCLVHVLAFRWLWAWSKVGTPDEGEEQGSVSDGRWSMSQAAGLSSFTKQLHNLEQVTTALNPGMSLFEVINQREVWNLEVLSRTPWCKWVQPGLRLEQTGSEACFRLAQGKGTWLMKLRSSRGGFWLHVWLDPELQTRSSILCLSLHCLALLSSELAPTSGTALRS